MSAAMDTDLAAEWRAMVLATREPDGPTPGDRWARRAGRFDRRSREAGAADPLVDVLGAHLAPGDEVVDVGAGAGRHVVPLARRCRRVVAVEPSASMREHLERRVAEEGLANVDVVADRWPSAARVEGDVVLSAHVLYGVEDAPAFLHAMDVAARRLCALCLGVVAPADALAPLRASVHGAAFPRRPAALDALALLHRLGLPAELQLLPGSERDLDFGATDDEVDELCLRVNVDPDALGRARVRRALETIAPADAAGRHRLGRTGPNALVTWRARAARG